MNTTERLENLVKWGKAVEALRSGYREGALQTDHPFGMALARARGINPWFTEEQILYALNGIAHMLDEQALRSWLAAYPELGKLPQKRLDIGLVLAGNIPAVGFHDILCVLVSGHTAQVKRSSDDPILLPFLLDVLAEIAPSMASDIRFVDRISDPGAVIATGSDNSARYFDYYFGKYPHIIRRNRNSVAVLDGRERIEDLQALGSDIFSFYGLGCRNVSKLLVPMGYAMDDFFMAMESYGGVIRHNKYMNNYDYHKALYLLNQEPFLTNNFLIVREHESLATPVSVLHVERYTDSADATSRLNRDRDRIQCVVGVGHLPFGTSQSPGPADYADGVDTLAFLTGLGNPAQKG
ncbi:MAG: acyl-CoA reductase [Bacteroidota bacterium]